MEVEQVEALELPERSLEDAVREAWGFIKAINDAWAK